MTQSTADCIQNGAWDGFINCKLLSKLFWQQQLVIFEVSLENLYVEKFSEIFDNKNE